MLLGCGPVCGFIPLGMGAVMSSSSSKEPRRVHPCVCGENSTIYEMVGDNRGEAPHSRGELVHIGWTGLPQSVKPCNRGETVGC